MKKFLSILLVILFIFGITGCSRDDNNGLPPAPNYTYVIGHSGGMSAQSQVFKSASNGYDISDIYGVGGITGLETRVYKVDTDGKRIPVIGSWSVEPAELGNFREAPETETHENFFMSAIPGSGKVKVYISADNAFAETNVYLYEYGSIKNYLPDNKVDFDSTDPNPDLVFDGLTLTAPNGMYVFEIIGIRSIREIPTTGYVTSYTFPHRDEIHHRAFIIKTGEGYYVKLMFGGFSYDPSTGHKEALIYYKVEKNPSATEFSY